jgi:hypothetical protein
MINYLYSYLIGNLALIAIWLALFFWRKDVRKPMLIVSFISGIIGLIVDPIYFSDWWSPQTITGTMPGIESFLLGFATAGIATVAYIELFSKKLRNRKGKQKKELEKNLNFITIITLSLALLLISHFILGWNTFYASFPALLIPLAIIYIKRKDLIIESLISGIILAILSLIFYIIPEVITPGWITSAWNFNTISGIKFLKVPIEDIIWFFMVGLLIGPLYEYWKDKKLVNKK